MVPKFFWFLEESFVWSLKCFGHDTLLKWRVFFKIKIQINIIYIICTLWTLRIWYILLDEFRWLPVNWTWMEGNIWHQGVFVCHFTIHIVYVMYQILGMHMICFPCFYFYPSRNILWQVGCLINWLIDGIRSSSSWLSSSLNLHVAFPYFHVWVWHVVFLVWDWDLNSFPCHELPGVLHH